MDNKRLQSYFLFILLGGVLVIAFFIFKPFLYALILAAVLAVVFKPLHLKILTFTGHRQGIAALLTTFIILILTLLPATLLGVQIFTETQDLYISLTTEGNESGVYSLLQQGVQNLELILPDVPGYSIDLDAYIKKGLSWLLGNLGPLFSNIIKFVTDSFIFLFALFYFLKDGRHFRKVLISLSPLADHDDETIFGRLELAVNSVVKGKLIVALIQGVLAGIGFTIFGVPNPTLWGMAVAFASLIPGIGTAFVIVPASIFLFISGATGAGIGLLIWGGVAVGLIDNYLEPKLLGKSTAMHPLVVLLSVVGGIVFFGPLGFLIGPFVLSLLFSLLDIYKYISKANASESKA